MIDRNVEFPNRFQLKKVPGTDDIYDIIPAPGDVIAPGDLFSKGNMLPDEIVSLLGLKMANPQVKDALNVLAHVGNLHVWERVQTYADPVPAGYTLGDEINGFLYVRKMGSANKYYEMTIQYGSNIGVSDDGTVYISDVTSYTNYPGSTDMQDLLKKMAGKYFKIVKFTYPDYFTSYVDELVYIPATATITLDSNINMQTDYQVVTGTPAIPAGTTTDYLTSTDRNDYHDNVTDAQDAYYSLGDVVSGIIVPVATSQVQFKYSTTVTVYDNGDLNVDGDVVNLQNYNTEGTSTIKGKYIVPVTTGASISGVWFIPSDATFSLMSEDGNPTKQYLYCDKMQPVIGHAATPASNTITYLGQLGGGARIEVGSYVGTGTYGSSNPNTLTFGFEPKLVLIFTNDNYYFSPYGFVHGQKSFIVNISSQSTDVGTINNITWNSTIVSWYASSFRGGNGQLSSYGVKGQLNASEKTYYYIAIG